MLTASEATAFCHFPEDLPRYSPPSLTLTLLLVTTRTKAASAAVAVVMSALDSNVPLVNRDRLRYWVPEPHHYIPEWIGD